MYIDYGCALDGQYELRVEATVSRARFALLANVCHHLSMTSQRRRTRRIVLVLREMHASGKVSYCARTSPVVLMPTLDEEKADCNAKSFNVNGNKIRVKKTAHSKSHQLACPAGTTGQVTVTCNDGTWVRTGGCAGSYRSPSVLSLTSERLIQRTGRCSQE